MRVNEAGPKSRRRRLALFACAAILFGSAGWLLYTHGRRLWVPWAQKLGGRRTVGDVVAAVDQGGGTRIRASLSAAGVAMPASHLWLVAIKDEKRLDLFGQDAAGRRVKVRSWTVLAASGSAGPKLREGDRQVPEGVYRIDQLNPNSAYHLSLRLDYPNALDRARATQDGRQRLGGDIFIHGKDVSVGCLAIGDEAIEELFWLVATVGKDAFRVVIAPADLRRVSAPEARGPAWIQELYRDLKREMDLFPAT